MLRIAGLEKLSLIDYPGKLSAIVFTHGCNLRCEYCHNPELVITPIAPEDIFDPEKVLKFLKSRKGKLDAVVITGGEPLLYDDLEPFLKSIKELGYLVKLDTNGLLPSKLKKLITHGVIDYISMDIKYPEGDYLTFTGENALKHVKESIDIIMTSGLDYEFRTTYVKGMHTTESSKAIGEMIKGAKQYYVQNFRAGKTINPTLSEQNSFTERELKTLKKNIKPYVLNAEIR
ncbi:anaerobic ribonucleoside-triphosphate reductase activating protein [Patescibacteria group bacterium]|nr:anaerobic ribonucleoside-triphosphate reductase activating protein [Patescibacteria group bacterium]